MNDDYVDNLAAHEASVLALTDALIGVPAPLTATQQAQLKSQYTDAQLAELALGIGLFLGMSKVLITLGLEPEEMPVTVLPTPGSRG